MLFRALKPSKDYQLAKIQVRNLFGKHISRIHGQKCCPYKQNGKPLSPGKVEEFVESSKINADPTMWWTPNEDFTRLTRSFYLNNIFSAVEFVKDIYEMDSTTT
jgi:pterin-4a-carbinolamine dehydratase